MKYLLSLLILTNWYIIQVSGVLEWIVIGKVTEYGQDATLFCNVSNCCPKDAGWDRWTPKQQTLFIDLKTGRPNKKYDGKIYRDGYTLIIKNLTEKDLNVSYSCLYGVTLGEIKFLLKEDVFTYISTEQPDVFTGNRAFSEGEMAAIIFGVIVLLAVTVVCFYLFFWRHRHRHNIGTAAYRLVMPEALEKDCFHEDPSNVECVQGEDAIMTCKVRPGSLPVKWMKDGNEIRQDENCQMYNEDSQYNLKLRNATTSDSGEYLVQVGQFSKKIKLKIKDCFPEDPPNDGNVDCFEGEDAVMTCKVCPGSQPVKWIKDGNEIRQNEKCQMYNEDAQYKLKLRNTITSDNGQYVVQVGQLSRKLHLRIIEIPGEITEGERKTYMDAIQSGKEVRKYVRIQVIGKDRVGKTSLVHRLLGYKQHDGKSTDGIAIDRKCQIRTCDGEWIVGEVATERKKNERIYTMLQNRGKGPKPVSNTPLLLDEHALDTKREPSKSEKEEQINERIPADKYQYKRKTRKDDTEPLTFHEVHKTKDANASNDIPAVLKHSSDEEEKSIKKETEEKPMKNSLPNENQNPINSDEAVKLTEETYGKMNKILLHAKNKKKKKEKMTLDGLVECGIWDFAGQKDYYATHQTFFTPHAIYLLVADIEDAITATEDDGNANFDTIGDYIDFWFDSIHCFCMNPSADKLCPHVIMVCTGIDRVSELEKKKADYEATFHHILGSHKKANHRRGIFFISNIDPREDEIKLLKDHISKIAKEENYFADDLPTRWINLENVLDVLKDNKKKICSLKDIWELALAYSIEEKELLLFLSYQHKIGNIIFFEDTPDFIILQPNWLVQCFRCLVCDDDKKDHSGASRNEMSKLKNEGELSEMLIDQLFKKEPDLEFREHKHHILKVMEKFDIIVKPKITNNSYYMPCMITNSSTLKVVIENNFAFENPYCSPWLVFEFKFLPIAYFNHILINYVRTYKVCKVKSLNFPGDGHPAIYPDKAIVYLDKTESRLLIICFSKNAISLQIYSALPPMDNEENGVILYNLCRKIAGLQRKLMHNLNYKIKAKCNTGNYKISTGRISYEELIEQRNEGKYMCKEHSKFHSSEDIENTWLKYAADELSPLEIAQADKNKGNKYFKGGHYDQAINCYTEAIKVCPPEEKQDLATFYHKRAAAYEKLMNLKMVVEDCTEALKNNSKHKKCLMRRADAAEQLGDLTQALDDVTALCILEEFHNPKSLMTADRVLKQLGQSKAKETLANRKPTMPSKHFIRTYLKAFTQDPVINEARTLDQSSVQNGETDIPDTDSPYYEALRQMNAEKFEEIIPNCTKEIDNDQSCKCVEARLLRATFYFLGGETEESLADFKLLTEDDVNKKIRVNALIKKGSILIKQGKQTDGLDCFAKAVRLDPDNADIYHHRGHHNIKLDRVDDAIRDLEFAVSKCPAFAASHVQKSFAEHRKSAEMIANSGAKIPLPQTVIDSYKNNVTMFPDNGDARAMYAQALTDAGKFDEADREFEKAIKLEPDNAKAMVHRGLLQLQWKQDVEEAIKIINQAIDVDNKCEYAYEVLGTLEVQRSNMQKAMDLFQKAIHLSRTESEMAHLYSLLDAAHAQLKVAKNLGITLPGPMGMGMP